MEIDIPVSYWIAFGLFVTVMLVLDLTVFHRKSHEPTTRESFFWTVFWCSLAVGFAGVVWWMYDKQQPGIGWDKAVLFISGYLTEWSLSMDNVFVFVVILTHFKIPLKYQYRVLFWGILAAVVMRLVFIVVGAAIVERFEWVLYPLGAFLIYTGATLVFKEDEVDPEQSKTLIWSRKLLPVAPGDHTVHGEKFFVRHEGKLMCTTLFLVLCVINITDIVFAVDSVPAIFGIIPDDTFLIFTSNVFAILGLRALYFLLADFMGMFHYLKYGLSGILIFVGGKMVIKHWIQIPNLISLLVIGALLALSIGASMMFPPYKEEEHAGAGGGKL
ncbi:MAG: TerC family protein [Planctomycetes bacterium]|nr:TerC family protein [Planctomycetota bacterium]